MRSGSVAARVRRLVESLLGGAPSRDAWRTGGGTVALSGATLVSNVVITFALARLAGADGYGVYAFAMAFSGLLAVPAVLGVSPLVVRTVAAAGVTDDWGRLRGALRRANQAVLSGSVVVVVLGAVGLLVLRSGRAELGTASLVALGLVPVIALVTVRAAVLQGLGRVLLARVPEAVVQPTVFLLLLVLLAATGKLDGVRAVGAQLAAAVVALVVGAVALTRALPAVVRAAAPVYDDRVWLRAIGPLLAINAVSQLTQRADVLLLGTLRGPTDAGVFAVANRAAGLCSFFLTAAVYPLAPLVARLWAEQRPRELQSVVTRAARITSLGALVIAVPMVVLAKPLLSLFGTEFAGASVALVVLCLGQVVNAVTGACGVVLMMTGHESEVARAVVVGSVAGIGLNVALIPPFGVTGAAVGTAVGLTMVNLVLVQRLRATTGVNSTAWS